MNFENKTILIAGVANKKSVAYFVAKSLLEAKAKVLLTVQNESIKESVSKIIDCPIIICDVTKNEHLKDLASEIKKQTSSLDGFVHSMAFARFELGQTYEQTSIEQFNEAALISCHSLSLMSQELKPLFTNNASVVTISISDTKATSYGFLGPIKSMLETSVGYLAKAFSQHSRVRFNAVGAGPLKTSASAGIPNYLENYLYAEKMTLRKEGVKTQEVANTVLFLLSDLSSGINGTTITVDAGMKLNAFDQELVQAVFKSV
jgi:enoyl-[acyl-carrier protein] reductase I